MQRRWSNNILILLRTLQTTKFFHLTAIFFPTKTLYIRFLSVYNSHINKLCKLYFLARSNCTSIFHAFNSFSYIWNGQFTVKIQLISIWLLHLAPKIIFIFFCIYKFSSYGTFCKFEWAGFTQTCLVQLFNGLNAPNNQNKVHPYIIVNYWNIWHMKSYRLIFH